MKKKLLIILTLILFTPFVVNAYEIKMDWQRNWEGNAYEVFSEILQIEDGAFIAIGDSDSTDIEGVSNKGYSDAIIVKFDKDGNVLWQKSWGGNNYENFSKILQTEDGDFIVLGSSSSTDIEGLPNKGSYDAVIVKYDKNGNLLWQKSLGGNGDDSFRNMFQTKKSEIIVFGSSTSKDIDGLPNKGSYDAVIVKYDEDGNLLWQKSWGGNDIDVLLDNNMIQTHDGGFVLYGSSASTDIDGLPNKGSYDAVIVKYDEDGNLLWQKSWGGTGSDGFTSMSQIEDDCFITYFESFSSNIEDLPSGGALVKIDKNGNVLFAKKIKMDQTPFSWDSIIKQSSNGDFIMSGCIYENDDDFCKDYHSAHLSKIDKDGNEIFNKFYKNENDIEHWWGLSNYSFSSIQVLKNNNILVNVYSYGTEDGMDMYDGSEDAIIIMYDKNGNVLWQKNWGGNSTDLFFDLYQTTDGGILAYGYTQSTDIDGLINTENSETIMVKYSFVYNLENIITENGTTVVEQKGKNGIITPTPNEGYEVDKIIIKDKDGNVLDVKINKQEDGTYSFDLYTDVSVEVIYKEKIENPKTGVSSFIGVMFTLMLIGISSFFMIRNCNNSYEL